MKPMILLAALCFVWTGMVLGISFLETPVKFTAPSVTLAIGLDVGRHVFGVFNRVEVACALGACGLMIMGRPGRAVWLPLGGVTLMVLVQALYLRPRLDARVELILHGQVPPPAPDHVIYIVLEVLKVVALIAAGLACLGTLQRSSPSA